MADNQVQVKGLTNFYSSGINIPQLLVAAAEAYLLGYDLKYGSALVASIALSNLVPSAISQWSMSASTEKYIVEPALASALCYISTHIIKGKKKPHKFALMGFIAGSSSAAISGSYRLGDPEIASNRYNVLRANEVDKMTKMGKDQSDFSFLLS